MDNKPPMDLISELDHEIYHSEQVHGHGPKSIRVHPLFFAHLIKDDDQSEVPLIYVDNNGNHYFRGIPLMVDPYIKKWNILF